MKFRNLFSLGWFCISLSAFAQVPPAEQLLPDDTIGLVTVPDWRKVLSQSKQAAFGRLWADAAMKPFRDNFTSNFQADFLEPLEKQLGIKFADYEELLQGQITLALTPPKEGGKEFSSFVFLADTQDKAGTLSNRLADLKKKWTEAGREVKSERIRDIEFSSVSVSGGDIDSLLKKAFPSPDENSDEEKKKSAEKTDLHIGQFKSLLIIGENSKAIEKIIARQSGGVVPPLAEKAAYQKSHALLFRDSLAHGWLNVKPIYTRLLKFAASEQDQEPQPGMPQMKMDKIMPALGFSSIESLAAKIGANADGTSFDFFLNVPEAQREGLFKVFTLEKKDAAPPAFVPADAVKFQRTRIDAPKAWMAIENMLQKIDPSLAGLVQLMLSSAGKDQDPNFDLKKNLLGNLGDDFIQYEKAPRSAKAADLQNLPTLLLLGSANPPQLLEAIRALTSLLPPPLSTQPMKEREFLGRKIYTLSMAAGPAAEPDADEKDDKGAVASTTAATQKLSFTTSAGYVAFSADDGMLEEYLRSAENPPRPLRATPGLAEAAQKVGGMENGLFTYENQAETLRFTMNALKNDPDALTRSSFININRGDEDGGFMKHLFDVKLLPPFERIAKYFGLVVVSGATTADGFVLKAYDPTPAGLKQ